MHEESSQATPIGPAQLEHDDPETPQAGATPRTILVDGFNVLHAVMLREDRRAAWWRREHRERLLERVCAWRGGPDQIWVAFDGAQPRESVWAEPIAVPSADGGPGPTIHSVFVESADDWIVRRARQAEDPDGTIVVSADRQVAGRARSAGCAVLTPWAFMRRCGPSDDRSPETTGPEPNPESESESESEPDA